MALPVGTQLVLARRKWPDSPHYEVSPRVLGDDAHGTWFGSRKGGTIKGPSGKEFLGEQDAIFCVPSSDWYLVHYWQDHPSVAIYVDICTPATWSDGLVSVIDLDLDVVRWTAAKGGHVELLDDDEFEEHRIALGYPDQLQADARRAAADILDRVTRAEPPFTLEAAAPWFAALAAL